MARGEGGGGGSGGDGGGGAVWSVLWFIILLLVSFWIAAFCAVWYIFFSTFSPCIKGLKPACGVLLAGVNFPRMCSENMLAQKPIG